MAAGRCCAANVDRFRPVVSRCRRDYFAELSLSDTCLLRNKRVWRIWIDEARE